MECTSQPWDLWRGHRSLTMQRHFARQSLPQSTGVSPVAWLFKGCLTFSYCSGSSCLSVEHLGLWLCFSLFCALCLAVDVPFPTLPSDSAEPSVVDSSWPLPPFLLL